MPLTQVTVTILRARVAALMDENARLRETNARLAAIIDRSSEWAQPETPSERDYGPGGMEWIDPSTGADTWHS